jgi:hypothetical protein
LKDSILSLDCILQTAAIPAKRKSSAFGPDVSRKDDIEFRLQDRRDHPIEDNKKGAERLMGRLAIRS